MEVSHLARIAGLDAVIAGVPGLFVTGAGLRVTGIPDCITEGTKAGTSAASAVTRA